MCGIAGIIGEVSPRQLDELTDALAHRGPDGRGTVISGSIGFGHRLLRIVGECPQPVEQDGCILTYNGEIYGIPGSLSDTARLIPLYRRYGFPGMLHHLNGMFAFGLYDKRKGVVYLARDRFGEKPLYYTANPFAFASEIKALTHCGEQNYSALRDYERFQFVRGRETLFRDVYKLEPASYLVVSDRGEILESGRYWDVPDISIEPGLDDLSDLKWLIEDAVRIRTRADVPVGTYVSGGLDSSLVTCLAKPLLAFCGDFPEPGYSELPYALNAARAAGSFLASAHIFSDDLMSCLDGVIYHLDEPAAGVGALPQYLVARLAARDVKVVLTGQGADEIFGGYARYADCAGIPRPDGYESYKLPEQYRGMTLDEAQRWDIEHSLPALLHVDDRVNMAHGIESRAPFLDHRIAEFVFSRPTVWRLQDRKLKGALRRIARGIVPDSIIDRTDKMGFPVPLMEWFGDGFSGSQRELWQKLSLTTWHGIFIEERAAA